MTTLRQVFWLAALGVIVCFAFFLALDAISLGDTIGLTVLVGVLCLLWVVHSVLVRRHKGERDRRLTSARERRGF